MSYRVIVNSTICLSLLALLLTACGKSSSPTTAPTGPGSTPTGSTPQLQIAVIPKGSTHEYWSSVHAGADQAGKELGVTINWKAPVLENDRAGQIQIVQQFLSEGVSGIVLAPLDNQALVPVVAQAKQQNVPVVIIDSSLTGTPGTDFTAFVATDNYHGGELAGQQMAKLLLLTNSITPARRRILRRRNPCNWLTSSERRTAYLPLTNRRHSGC